MTWHTANRDQAGIAKDLAEGKDIVFGFKIWVVWDPNSRLPLAMRFATIAVHDINFAQEVVQQAIDNLGEHAKITSLAIDRGFTDGIFLWWINCKNITFLFLLNPTWMFMTMLCL
ncbi:MAG: transposase [Thermodesulfobacteriota bacterium]